MEFEGKRTNHYTGRGFTAWDRWFIKSFPTSILREWFARKRFRGQPMESEMASFPQPSLLSGKGPQWPSSKPNSTEDPACMWARCLLNPVSRIKRDLACVVWKFGVLPQVSSPSFDYGSKRRGAFQNNARVVSIRDINITKLN
ncbi:hypothetical protein AVEN_148104-1 [Araneus ventricosus]|uniref:Uncharacterized protein n=1 Tax=Araneus ventricosus TaxID=182803 RepID=A0A4Y2U356_ARAVE|nr:hypothetical protein AVEN_148104-1 [Araneus ventricosus]